MSAPSPAAQNPNHTVVLLDLSGDEKAAISWAHSAFPGAEIQRIHKQDLKWASKAGALRVIRDLKPRCFAVFSGDLRLQSARVAISLVGAVAGARTVALGDRRGRTSIRSRHRILLLDAPKLALELAAGLLVLIPFMWGASLVLRWLGPILKTARSSQDHWRPGSQANKETRSSDSKPKSVLYLRAAPGAAGPASAQAGGMTTHVAGFASGALSLGHHLKFVSSGAIDVPDNNAKVEIAPPSENFNATRTLFELSSSVLFTLKAFSIAGTRWGGFGAFDFIYQRYNRFNCAGAILSIASGLPLLLEFNGSEVWVAKHWDPIGQIGLLAHIEQFNLEFADLIFVVSEADKRKLSASGLDVSKVVVNPNGVDTEKFRPGCGGDEVRRNLGLDNKIVIGFLGTFGPWHGASVLAQAAALLAHKANYHFLFIGDGDHRPEAEAIINQAGGSRLATFTGRIPHQQAAAFLDACDILSSPHVETPDKTEFFGSPTKLFEYLAMGKPVISSRLGQMASIIEDGVNGLLVPPGDARALADAIDILASDEPLRRALGERARETVVRHFTWRQNAARVFDAFEERVAERGAEPAPLEKKIIQ